MNFLIFYFQKLIMQFNKKLNLFPWKKLLPQDKVIHGFTGVCFHSVDLFHA